MVAHALHDVAGVLGVEESHGQGEELTEEVGDDGQVDPHAHVEQQPAAHEVDGRGAEREHELPGKHEPYEAYVALGDAAVDYGLGEQRQQQLQGAAHGQPRRHVGQGAAVAPHVAQQEAQRARPGGAPGSCVGPEACRRLQEQGYALVLAAGARAEPALLHLAAPAHHQPPGGVGKAVARPAAAALYAVKHHEVLLPPMEDGGQRHLAKGIKRKAASHRVKPIGFGCAAQPQQRRPLGRGRAKGLHLGHGAPPPIVLKHHAEAGHAALHGIVLEIQREAVHVISGVKELGS